MALLSGIQDLPVTKASFRFILNSTRFVKEKPYHFSGPLDPDDEPYRTNITLKAQDDVPVKDIRTHIDSLDLNVHGFQFIHHKSECMDNLERQDVLEKYMNEVAVLLKDHLAAERVICFDYRFRLSLPAGNKEAVPGGGAFDQPNEPAWQVHVDNTVASGLPRARMHLTNSEAAQYLDGTWRIRLINVWRPLNGTVEDAPLAFCDWSSVDVKDFIATDRPSREYVGEVYYPVYSDDQRWYWLSDQSPEELSVFLSYDSEPKLGAAYSPHTAFRINQNNPGRRMRRSLEIRTIVINKK